MNRFFLCAFAVIAFALAACNNDTAKDTDKKNSMSEEDKALLDNIKKSAPVKIEPQPLFDQSQLNDNALGLCLKFKTLDNHNRKEVFEKLEPLLPNCPTEMGDNNETTANFDETVQRMHYNDLFELLGEPDEANDDGEMGYFLMEDKSYKVVFMPDEQGIMACRYYEGSS